MNKDRTNKGVEDGLVVEDIKLTLKAYQKTMDRLSNPNLHTFLHIQKKI